MKEFEQFSRMEANYNSDVSIYVSRRGKFGLNISSHTLHTSNYKKYTVSYFYREHETLFKLINSRRKAKSFLDYRWVSHGIEPLGSGDDKEISSLIYVPKNVGLLARI